MRMACATVAEDQVEAATYVDDPLMTFCGTDGEIELSIGKVTGLLLAMGYALAFNKAQDSNEVEKLTWTSAVLELLHQGNAIRVSLEQEILDDLKEMLE